MNTRRCRRDTVRLGLARLGVTLSLALALTLVLAAMPVLIMLIVFHFCRWLVNFTGKAESLREVAPVLRALQDLVRARRR